ncbi:minor histocompatibility antigen H13-like [Glossina fuscipes fuscipes]
MLSAALLYLVPACMGTPLLVALVCGDLTLFAYEDHPEETTEKKENNDSEKSNKKKECKKAK